MHKTWQIDFSSSGGVVREIQVSKGLPEAVFNNITKVMFEGRKTFKLTVEQIPSSIEEFVFICQATESIWSVPATSEVEVTLASEFFVIIHCNYMNARISLFKARMFLYKYSLL